MPSIESNLSRSKDMTQSQELGPHFTFDKLGDEQKSILRWSPEKLSL
jgi:hypothetical protein